MNPSIAFAARTARLAREAQTPVYSTTTPVREHLYVAEMESDFGRSWTKPMKEADLNKEVDSLEAVGYWVSDWDHAAKCWCFK